MKCTSCGYLLWGVGGQCPECGQDFRVDQYWLEPGGAALVCPNCGDQRIYQERSLECIQDGRYYWCRSCEGKSDIGMVKVVPVSENSKAYSDQYYRVSTCVAATMMAGVIFLGCNLIGPGMLFARTYESPQAYSHAPTMLEIAIFYFIYPSASNSGKMELGVWDIVVSGLWQVAIGIVLGGLIWRKMWRRRHCRAVNIK